MGRAWSGCLENARTRRASRDRQILDTLGRDDLVSSLLVLYGLHPLSWRRGSRGRWKKARAAGTHVETGEHRSRGGPAAAAASTGTAPRRKVSRTVVEEAVYRRRRILPSCRSKAAERSDGFVPLEMLRAARGTPNKHE